MLVLKPEELCRIMSINNRHLCKITIILSLSLVLSKLLHRWRCFFRACLRKLNIRGWLVKIKYPAIITDTGDLFGMELLYNSQNPNKKTRKPLKAFGFA